MPDPPTFGRWLRQQRKARDLTQKALAQLVPCAGITLRKIEADTLRPSRQLALKLAHLLADTPAMAEDALRMARFTSGEKQPVVRHDRYAALPTPPASFIGRNADITRCVRLLQTPGTRLVTLVGPPGVGKTRLGISVAHAMQDTFSHGVVYVGLAAVQSVEQVTATVALALGLNNMEAQPLPELVFLALQRRHMLLLLDNFEHLMPAATQVAYWLAHCPRLVIVVTSRASLHLQGESVYLVPPLASPPPGKHTGVMNHTDLEHIEVYPAISLFVQRARAVRQDFGLTPDNVQAVINICHYLDGLPLAIELAVARLRLFTPQVLYEQLLKSCFTLLTNASRDLPDHQHTLRHALEWSYALLSAQEQTLFRKLGVFVGGWQLEAAIALCPGEPAEETTTYLANLVDQSLVQTSETVDGQTRFLLLETVRSSARELLETNHERSTIQELHAHYYCSLAELAERELGWGPRQAFWLRRITPEIPNMRAVLNWALEADSTSTVSITRVELGLRLNGALWGYWLWRGSMAEGCSWFEQLIEAGKTASHEARAKALFGAACLEQFRSNALAVTYSEQSLQLFTTLRNQWGIAQSLHVLGRALRIQGTFRRSVSVSLKAIELFDQLQDSLGMIWVWLNLGDCARDQRNFSDAIAHFEAALRLSRSVGDTLGSAYALHNLGRIAYAMGDKSRALSFLNENQTAVQTLDVPTAAADFLGRIAYIIYANGDLQHAKHLFRETLAYWWETGSRMHLLPCFEGLAAIATVEGNAVRAAQLFGAAASLRDLEMIPVMDDQRADYERDMVDCKAALSPEIFTSSWNEGRTMSLEQVVALLLK